MRWIPDWNMWALHIPTAPMARDFHAALLADKSMAATAAKVNRALDIPGVSTGPRGRRGCSPAAAAENGDLYYGLLMK